jgi:signal transduction histidine kinase/ligand-binding sensor domain-containing protein
MRSRQRYHKLHLLLVCLVAGFLASKGHASSPDLKISQLFRTAWTAEEGAPTNILSLAQTRDGYLWIGAVSGLTRFDGVRFERMDRYHGQPLLSSLVNWLWAPPSGGLWVGYTFGGASFISNGSLMNYGEPDGLPVGSVRGFAQDKSGAMWVATTRGLRRFDGSRWVDVSAELGLPKTYVSTLQFDRSGTLWVVVNDSLMYRQPGQRALTTTDIRVSGEFAFVEGPDGILWLNDTEQGIRALYVPFDPTMMSKDWIRLADPRSGPTYAKFIDRQGALWFSTQTGLRRLMDPARLLHPGLAVGAPAAVVSNNDVLTLDGANWGLQDREGNVWIAGVAGLNRFRESRLIHVDFPADRADLEKGVALVAGDDGAMMLGLYTKQGAFRIKNGSSVEAVPGPGEISCAYRDPDGIFWFGGPEKIWHSAGQRWVAIDLPVQNYIKTGFTGVQAMTKDRSGALWVSIVRVGVFRLVDGKWSRYGDPAVSLTTDSEGRLWLGYPNSQIQIVYQDTVRHLSATDGLDVGAVLSIDARTRNVWVGGEHGLAYFDGRRFNTVTRVGGATMPAVSGIVVTSEGDLWLSTPEGAMKVSADEVRRVVSDPRYAVRYTLLDFLDGMPGSPRFARPLPSMVEGTDGRLWVSTGNGIAWTDPKHVVRNALVPPVDIQAVIGDGVRYEPSAGLKLPTRTRNLQINYTALSLSIPERVMFRYQLGPDQPWQDVGTRREAYFTDLPPGQYTFHVIASNNDGVWNETGATIHFEVPPAFIQTKWFLGICITAGAVALWLLFMLRLRHFREKIRGQLEVRLDERERIARDLHDTLFQNIQGVLLTIDNSTNKLSESNSIRGELKDALRLSDEVMAESRERILELRAEDIERKSIGQVLSQVGTDLSKRNSSSFRVVELGSSDYLHPVVFEEVLNICREALFNAFQHSGATNIEAEILFERDTFSVRISDDGVGIDEQILSEGGRPGHFGLKGMVERANKLGAKLTIRGKLHAGTEIELSMPMTVAVGARREGWRRFWPLAATRL